MSLKPETRFKVRALERLRAIPGSEWEKIQQKAIRGTLDIFGCYRGRMVVIELKTDNGTLDPLQRYRITRWQRSGAMVITMTPTTLEKDIETIRLIGDN